MLTNEEKVKTVHICRVSNYQNQLGWILFDKINISKGRNKESRNQLIRRWQKEYGQFGTLIRFKGICRPSELVACISSIQRSSDNRENVRIGSFI